MSGRGKSAKGAAKPTNDIIPANHPETYTTKKVIELFLECFKYILASEELPEMVQLVKGELFNRNYIEAFNSEDKRLAYVARWVPARALAYASLFASLDEVLQMFRDPVEERRVLCVGGGAASEVVGLASLFSGIKLKDGNSSSSLHVDVVDIADWTNIVHKVSLHVQQKWLYDGTSFSSSFVCGDVLQLSAEELHLAEQNLVTLLFTTNELFCEKRMETVRFLQLLSKNCRKGSYLLITESAGSYSHITVGLKQFPVQFLIDTILVGKPSEKNGPWEIVQLSESCWYRVDDREIDYPVKLENMRFFYRLYRKK
ncbi:hypothetical protein PUMCH_004010 [Australozyma saopauloensis]|uniref:25S rRNA (Uridine(2843)-N(3))-methyltransferase n=1 Tax=Australozyma saopauloensis TaxID=291208 RepID=A0AAX4HDW3_9ASCO|nr:hypothetical protein PUMCH_004010 [[Candida] saopauloensis]